jgi:hypothetical protein
MAHFAEINSNNRVLRVVPVVNTIILDKNGQESEELGQEFLSRTLGGNWIQTSYNARIRKNYAGIGMIYDASRDAFMHLKPANNNSWVLNEDTCQWEPPIAYPDDGKLYKWDESTISWKLSE